MNDRPIRGMVLMTLSVFLIIAMNMFAKLVADQHIFIEAVFYRNVVALLTITLLITGQRKFHLFKTDRLKGQILRGFAGTLGMSCVFWAYSLMPMAEVTAIMFTGGLITTIMSAVILKEQVGPYRWAAVILGFLGAFVIVSPSGTAITPMGITAAFLAAFIGGGVVSIMLRSLGKTENAQTTVFYFMLIGTVSTAPFAFHYGHLPTAETLPYLIACGLTGVTSLLTKTQAYRYAEASLLSPIMYTGIIWATLFGWLIWSDWPTPNIWIGALVIIGSNLFILWREKQKKINREQTADL